MPHRKDPLDLLLDAIFDQIFDAEWTGRHGEKLTAKQLKRLAFFMGEGKVLRNVYVPKEGGGTSEIDVLFITSRGVFVIESKNYSGWIFGDEADRNWTARLQSGQSNRFYNPIRQNRGHLKWLGRYVGQDVPLYSLVVFSKRCELKKITVTSEDVAVIKRDELGRTVRRIWEAAEGVGPVDVDGVCRRLEPLTHADAEIRAEHVEEARAAAARGSRRTGGAGKRATGAAGRSESAFGEPVPLRESVGAAEEGAEPSVSSESAPVEVAAEAVPVEASVSAAESAATAPGAAPGVAPAEGAAPEPATAPESPRCPRCGKSLVVRTAKRGPNAGNRFWGCSGYPSCRYTRPL